MALLKKFAGETVIYGIGSVLPRVLNFALLPYITRKLGEGEFGNHGVMYAFAALLLVFFTHGMETALFRFGSKDGMLTKSFSTAATSVLLTSLTIASFLFLFADQIAVFLESPGKGIYIKWFAAITVLDGLAALPFAKLRLQNRPIQFAAIRILNVLILLATIFFILEICPWLISKGFVWFENIYAPEKALDYFFIANLVASIFTLLILSKEFIGFKWQFDKKLWVEMIIYSSPLIVVGLASVINRQLDRIFLKKLAIENAAELTGIYNAGVKIAVLMSLFITAFNYAAEPFFFKNADRSDAKKIYAQLGQAFAIVGSLAFLGILFYRDIVELLLGRDFREGMKVVPVLLLAYFFLGLFYNFSIWYKLTDNTRIGAWISVGGATITIFLNFLLIPTQGMMGPAWAALACYIFMATISFLIGKKYYPIDYPIGKMLGYISVAVLFYFVSEWFRYRLEEQLIYVLFVNTLLLGAYLFGLYFLERKTIAAFWKQDSG